MIDAGVRRTPAQRNGRPDQTPFHRFIAGDVDEDAGRPAWPSRKTVPFFTPIRMRKHPGVAEVELLTTFEHHVLWVVRMRMYRGLGSPTLRSLTPLVGASGPGRTWHALNRLRWRGLIGFRGVPGRDGRLDLWIPRAGREAIRRTLASRPRTPRIDSPATPFGGFLTRDGRGALAETWPKRYVDRLEGAPSRRAPPGRTYRLPPMFLTQRCPKGHSVRLRRAAFAIAPRTLTGRWEAVCHRCRRWVIELVEITVPRELVPRSREAVDLARRDPDRFADLVASARAAIADPSTPLTIRDQLRRDYLDE